MLTVKEPRRRGLMATVKSGGQADSQIPLREVTAYVWRNRKAYSSILYTIPIISILGYAYMGWYPEFLLRTYQVDGGMHGIITGVIYLVFGTAATLGGAWFSEWLTRKGYRDANVRLLFLVGVSLFVPAVVGPLMPTMTLALLFGVPAICLLNCYFGVAMAGLNRITPNQMRAQLVAFLLFLSNILGLGFGTSFVAGLTEFLFADDNALNYSLSMVGGIVSVLTALLAWRGLPHYRAALGQSQELESQTDSGFGESPALG